MLTSSLVSQQSSNHKERALQESSGCIASTFVPDIWVWTSSWRWPGTTCGQLEMWRYHIAKTDVMGLLHVRKSKLIVPLLESTTSRKWHQFMAICRFEFLKHSSITGIHHVTYSVAPLRHWCCACSPISPIQPSLYTPANRYGSPSFEFALCCLQEQQTVSELQIMPDSSPEIRVL